MLSTGNPRQYARQTPAFDKHETLSRLYRDNHETITYPTHAYNILCILSRDFDFYPKNDHSCIIRYFFSKIFAQFKNL